VNSLPNMSGSMLRIADATPDTEPGFPHATRCNSHDAPLRDVDIATVFSDAVTRAGLTQKEAAALMKLDPAHWSRQRNSADGQHISVQRLFEHMPRAFWLELLQRLAPSLGVVIAHPDIADRALNELFTSVQNAVTYALQDRALRQQRTGTR
jgi:hypothetical protein